MSSSSSSQYLHLLTTLGNNTFTGITFGVVYMFLYIFVYIHTLIKLYIYSSFITCEVKKESINF